MFDRCRFLECLGLRYATNRGAAHGKSQAQDEYDPEKSSLAKSRRQETWKPFQAGDLETPVEKTDIKSV